MNGDLSSVPYVCVCRIEWACIGFTGQRVYYICDFIRFAVSLWAGLSSKMHGEAVRMYSCTRVSICSCVCARCCLIYLVRPIGYVIPCHSLIVSEMESQYVYTS
jgi:hypothetical protein